MDKTSNLKNISSIESEEESKNERLTFTIFPYDSQHFTLNEDDPDYFSTILPEEMILYIFKFLSIRDLRICAMVSKYWSMLSSSEVLYRDITLYNTSVEVSYLEKILNLDVQALKLQFVKMIIPPSAIQPFFTTQRFNSLQRITICDSNNKFELTEELLASSPNLKAIKLGSIHNTLGITFFRHLIKLQFLETLHFKRLRIDNIPEIIKIFKKADKFKELKVLILNYAHILAQSGEFLECLLKLCPNLEVLKLIGQQINHTVFGSILRIKHLKILNICYNTLAITSFGLLPEENHEKWNDLRELNTTSINVDMPERINERLLGLSPNLNILCIEGVITLTILKQILGMKNLNALYVVNADLTALNNFHSYEKFDELQRLSIFKNGSSETPLLSNLLWHCEEVRELELGNFDFNEDMLRGISEMRNLEKLKLTCIKMNQPFNAEGDFLNFRLKKLKFLHLIFYDQNINPSLVEMILLSCRNIASLEMYSLSITEGIWKIILSMSELENLHLLCMDANDISYVPDAIDNSRRSIASMEEPNKVSLHNVSEITNAKINIILKGCPKLKRENISILYLNY